MAGRNDKRPQEESIHYSFVPNHRETMQALARASLTNQEYRVIIALLNQTNGRLKEDDAISSTFWQALTLMSRQSVHASLQRLGALGVIGSNGGRYKMTHPNVWDPRIFRPQRLTRRAAAQASTLLSEQTSPESYQWLRRMVANIKFPSPKKSIPTHLRWEVFERDNFTCRMCGTRRNLTVDHIIPEHEGGLTVTDNLQTLCKRCNSKKGCKAARAMERGEHAETT